MRLRRRGDHWLLVGGPVPPGSAAITIGSVVSVRRRYAGDARLLRHEEEHVRQWRELGYLRFLRQYLGAYVRWRRAGFGHQAAYRLIPLEVEAEAAADRFSAAAGEGAGQHLT
ncbi:MAG TPA: hypothetical protein VL337_08395 [Acidimicrobiales bacterium]|nr:hypothetical protein [Acidimicrobiales bacterium]